MKQLLLVFLLSYSASSFAQTSYWEKLNPPPGGVPSNIVQIANGWVYAEFYDHSMYCSKDEGASWQQIFWPSNDPDTGFLQIRVGRAGTLFAERNLGADTWNDKPYHFDVFRSIDNGASWQVFTDSATIHGIGQTSTGSLIAIKEITSNGSQLVRSEDNGASWISLFDVYETRNSSVEVDIFDHLLVSDKDFTGYVWISKDYGQTWITRYIEFADKIVLTPTGTMLYLEFDYLRRQEYDSPISEITVADSIVVPGDYPHFNGLIVLQNGNIILNTSTHFYISYDDGQTWEVLPNYIRAPQLLGKWSLADNSFFISRIGTCMSKTTDLGQTFTFSGAGMNRGDLHKLYIQSNTCWLAVAESGLLKTTDEGQHWQLLKENLHKSPWPYDENDLVLDTDGLYVLNNDSLFFSNDLGLSFQLLQLPDSTHPRIVSLGTHEPTHSIFVNRTDGLARSTDMGMSWQTVADSLYFTSMRTHPSGALFSIMAREMITGNFNFYGHYTYTPALYRSQDGGQTWELLLSEPVKSFTINQLGEVFVAKSSSITLKSLDGGNTWNVIAIHGEDIFSNDANQLVSSNHDKYISLSNDGGNSFFFLPQVFDNDLSLHQLFSFDQSNRLYTTVWDYPSQFRFFRTSHPTTSGTYLSGIVYKDADADCSTQDVEMPLASWLVKAEGTTDTWWASTDSAGRYTMFLDTGAYFLSVKPVLKLLWETCADSLPIQLSGLQDTTQQDLPVKAIADCPYMTVDIAVPWLEKCFESLVFVQYCNRGTEAADSAWIDVTLDPYLTFTDTLHPIPHTWVDSTTIRFFLGTIPEGYCDVFNFSVYTDCDSTLLGQTLCVSAHVYPDSLCIESPNWSGAEIQVVARCEEDTATTFEVINVGNASSQSLHYFVIEDDVVMFQGDESYEPNTPHKFSLPANGHFRRFESEQEPGHPFSLKVAAATEGCGGFNALGFPNWYFLNNGIPSQAVYCGEIVGAFDPNDKQGLPFGYGDEHLVAPNTDINYMIRFQNTGTAAAHTVVIRDTLSGLLDPGTIRIGAASHPFTWNLSGQGFLTITFENINLPDSNSNEAASHGFLQFRISQQADLPDGSEIGNTASIYFDFNEAVRTNKTTHRIGRNFIELVPTQEPGPGSLNILVSPNPVASSAVLTLAGLPAGDHYLTFSDVTGKVSARFPVNGNRIILSQWQLKQSMYFFQVIDNKGVILGSGKVLVR